MRFKKMAMLTLAAGVIFGVSGHTASASTDTTEFLTVLEESAEVQETEASEEAVPTESLLTAGEEETVVATEEGSSLKKSSNTKSYTKKDLRLMASIINCEAGGECYQGKLAVGIVVMNRVSSKKFPNTIKKVIYQKSQFSPVTNGSLKKKLAEYDAGKTDSKQWKSCISAAKKVLNGQRTIIYKGSTKNMKGYYFFSVYLSGAKFKLGGHRFK